MSVSQSTKQTTTTILILAANPKGTVPLRLEEEIREIREGLKRSRYRDRFVVEYAMAARPRDVQRAMLDYNPQVVHFCGHGEGEQGLVLEDETGAVKLVSTEGLASLFSLFSTKGLSCVLLNACYSEVQAKAIARHIDSVIGMNQSIGDRAAIEFATSFYDALGAGESVNFAFALGVNAMQLQGIREDHIPKLIQKSNPSVVLPDQPPPEPPPPQPQIEQIPLEPPDGTMDRESQFYVEREVDKVVMATIQRQGVTITIKGPRQIGKSSMLMRVMAAAERMQKQVVYLDFQLFDQQVFGDQNCFYRQFCSALTIRLKLSDRVEEFWRKNLSHVQRCTDYIQSHLLIELNASLLLAMDDVDRMFESPFRSDFFGMLRSWHNNRALPMNRIWKKLDLALLTATEPYYWIDNLNQSPFNFGEKLTLTDFTSDQVHILNQKHGLPFDAIYEQQLNDLLNGHPYLVRKALYLVASGQWKVDQLFAKATSDNGPFAAHLREHLHRIIHQQDLIQGMLQVIRQQTCRDQRLLRLLMADGLVVQHHQNRVVPRCRLFAEYFGERLNG
jgi:hypothetical protein